MKQKIIKGVAIATLCLIFTFTLLPKSKANSISTYEKGENLYEEYKEFYHLLSGHNPPQYTEMLDICSNANPNLTNDEVIDRVYVDMLEYLMNNSGAIINHFYTGGFEDGKIECESTHTDIEQSAYLQGKIDCENSHTLFLEEAYNNGYDKGEEDGIKKGIIKGYAQYEEEKGSSFKLKDLVFSIINAPFNIIKGALNFEIFGVNVSGLVLFLISCGLVFFVIKFFMK